MGTNCQNKVFNWFRTSKFTKSILQVIGCSFVVIILLWLYSKCVTIPIYRHYYQAEHLLSNNESTYTSIVSVVDNKGFNSRPNLNQANDTVDFYSHIYRFSPSELPPVSQPIYSNKKETIADILGNELYEEFCNYCSNNNIDITAYNEQGELFYFCHLSNARWFKKQKQGITHKGRSIFIQSTNDFSFIRGNDTAHYRHYPEEKKQSKGIGKRWLNTHNYRNIQTGYVLTLKKDDWFRGGTRLTTPSNFMSMLLRIITPEDISQAYYDVKYYSKSIKNIRMTFDYYSAITCETDPLYNSLWEVGMNKIVLSKYGIKYDYGDCLTPKRIHVAFNDMKNLQNMRLVILGVLLSVAITELFKNIIILLRLIPFRKKLKKLRYHLCKK